MTDLTALKALKSQADALSAGLGDLIAAETPTTPPTPPTPPVEPPITPPPVTPPPTPPVVGGAVAKDVSEIIAKIKAGDRKVYVRRGYLGQLTYSGINPLSAGIAVLPEDPSDPATFTGISSVKSSGIATSGFKVIPSLGAKVAASQKYLVTADAASTGMIFSGLEIRARDDADDFTNWLLADWTAWAWSGIQFLGKNNTADRCKMIGVNFGFSTLGDSAVIADNEVFGFSGDAYRINGNYCNVLRNRGTDSHKINGNHCDLFQSFGKKHADGTYEPITGTIYEDNVGIEWTVRRSNPLREKLQGFGMYNGQMIGIVMRRNRLETTSFTGVTINSGKDCTIEDNYFGNVDKVVADCGRFKAAGVGMTIKRNQAPKFIGSYNFAKDDPDANRVAPF